MEINEIVLNGNNQAWVRWKADIELLLEYVSPAKDRTMRGQIIKAQWRGHQRVENEVDEYALRDFYCKNVIKEVRGLTKDGEAFAPSLDQLKAIWDGNHEFGLFVIEASRKIENFIAEKKS